MDALVMMWVWLAVIAVSAFIEAFTLQMVSIWFVPGGLVALILYFCGVGYDWQIIACIVVSLALLIGLRRFCLKILFKDKNGEGTNVNSFIGQKATLLKEIAGEERGELRINDVVWTAVSEDNSNIPAGAEVQIVAVRGNKLIVKAI